MSFSIEALQYRLPAIDYLDQHHNRGDLLKDGSFYDWLVLVEQMGFRQGESLPAKKGTWEIWERPYFAIPNFPEGETVIHSSLGKYRRWGNEGPSYNAAILRTSYEPIPAEEFRRDLASFTRFYVERARLWGFPSRLMTADGLQHLAAYVGGVVLGGAMGFFVDGTLGSVTNGAVLAIPSIGLSGVLHASSEWWAKRHIPHINQYMSGQTAEDTLVKEQNRITEVLIQRELYVALQNEGFAITPEDFTRKIYGQMPYSLRQRRAAEITSARTAESDSDKIPEIALPNILGVARVILTVA